MTIVPVEDETDHASVSGEKNGSNELRSVLRTRVKTRDLWPFDTLNSKKSHR